MVSGRKFDRPSHYRIRVEGTLDPKWSDWFDGFTIVSQPEGDTVLTGQVPDQAALHGVLTKIAGLGLPLLSVERLKGNES